MTSIVNKFVFEFVNRDQNGNILKKFKDQDKQFERIEIKMNKY